jgi:hypothetical protein
MAGTEGRQQRQHRQQQRWRWMRLRRWRLSLVYIRQQHTYHKYEQRHPTLACKAALYVPHQGLVLWLGSAILPTSGMASQGIAWLPRCLVCKAPRFSTVQARVSLTAAVCILRQQQLHGACRGCCITHILTLEAGHV